MGSRAVCISEDLCMPNAFIWPEWIKEKHDHVEFSNIVKSLYETKYLFNLADDIQKAVFVDNKEVFEDGELEGTRIVLAILHDCGGITRCEITQNKILYTTPEKWSKSFTNYYDTPHCSACNNECSDAK
jgi:hypothetical protein